MAFPKAFVGLFREKILADCCAGVEAPRPPPPNMDPDNAPEAILMAYRKKDPSAAGRSLGFSQSLFWSM
jgi:hypothetical protein